MCRATLGVLVQLTGGEARTVVLNLKVNQGKPEEFAAVGMFAKRYNPKNLACLDTGVEASDNQGCETCFSDGGRVGSGEGQTQKSVR